MNKSKLITLILALALIVTSIVAVAITASAEEDAPTIGSKNLYYWTDTSIGVQVKYTGTGTAGLMVYDSEGVTDLAAFNPAEATPIWQNFEKDTYAGVEFYLTQPIAANDMSYPYILVAAAKVGDEIVYGEKQFYSVTAYAYERLGENPTAAQKKLYNNLLTYAEAAEGAIGANGGAPLAHLEITNGYFGKYDASVGGINGDTYRIYAEATNPAGEYFCGWANENGEIVSTQRTFNYTIPANASGAIVYKAVYGEQAESIYKDAVVRTLESYTVTGEALTSSTKPSWFAAEGSSHYSRADMRIVDGINGDKELSYQRSHLSSGQYFASRVSPESGSKPTSFEVDWKFDKMLYNGNGTNIILQMKTADGTAFTLRIDLTTTRKNNTSGTFHLNPNNDKTASVGGKEFEAFQTNTLRFEFVDGDFAYNAETGESTGSHSRVDVYVNGELIGNIDIVGFYEAADKDARKATLAKLLGLEDTYVSSSKTYTYGEDKTISSTPTGCYIYRVDIGSVSSSRCDYTVDNLIFE